MNKIKSLRVGRGISQEELAEITGLSLRTIQRIENGETSPRGDSLKRMCQALGVTIEALREDKTSQEPAVDRGILVLINLSALAFLIPVPGLGIAAPLALWLVYRNRVEGAYDMGRRMVNFQITWLLVKGVVYGTALMLELSHTAIPGLTFMHFWLFMRVLDAFNINCIVINAIRAGRDKTTNYAPAITFFPS